MTIDVIEKSRKRFNIPQKVIKHGKKLIHYFMISNEKIEDKQAVVKATKKSSS